MSRTVVLALLWPLVFGAWSVVAVWLDNRQQARRREDGRGVSGDERGPGASRLTIPGRWT